MIMICVPYDHDLCTFCYLKSNVKFTPYKNIMEYNFRSPRYSYMVYPLYTIDISKMVAQCYDGAICVVDTREYQHVSKK